MLTWLYDLFTEKTHWFQLANYFTPKISSEGTDFTNTFVLQTDASDRGVGAVLSQKHKPGEDRLIAYLSRKLLPKRRSIQQKILSLSHLRRWSHWGELFPAHYFMETTQYFRDTCILACWSSGNQLMKGRSSYLIKILNPLGTYIHVTVLTNSQCTSNSLRRQAPFGYIYTCDSTDTLSNVLATPWEGRHH